MISPVIGETPTVAWQWGGQSPGIPRVQGPPSSRPKIFLNNFPVTVFVLSGRIVHMGETFNAFADFRL